jgi:uncharacterized protein (TIGR01777 family)
MLNYCQGKGVKMKILISGATGLIGKQLVKTLSDKGNDELVLLARNKSKAEKMFSEKVSVFEWRNPASDMVAQEAFEGVDAIIHLAGEPIAEGRWTTAKKERLWNSRVDATKNLITSLENAANHQVKSFVSSSAIGFYGSRDDETLDEESSKGSDYLADLCSNWEQAAHSEKLSDTRFVQLRTGIVLSIEGGALTKMLPPFKLGAGGRLGSGTQWMSWIHIQDMVNLIIFSMENNNVKGVVNATAPNPVTNSEFTKVLASTLNRPAIFPVPGFVLKTIFGEMSCILLEGQKVIPKKSLNHEFNFQYASLSDALESLLVKKKNLKALTSEA